MSLIVKIKVLGTASISASPFADKTQGFFHLSFNSALAPFATVFLINLGLYLN